MWDELDSDIPDSSDAEGMESPDYGDTTNEFGETMYDAPIEIGETGDTSFDADTPLEEDDLGSSDSSMDMDDADTGSASIGMDQVGETPNDLDAPFDEDVIEGDESIPVVDTQDQSTSSTDSDVDSEPDGTDIPFDEDGIDGTDSMIASDSMDEDSDPLEEDEMSEAQEGDDSMMEGPVLRRDPEELADILERTWLQRAEILRDDLRDKGWEDGPQMEEYVASQMDQWRTEADQTNQTYSGTPDMSHSDEPFEEDFIPDTVSEGDDSEETIEGTSPETSQVSDANGLELFEEDAIPDVEPSGSEIETTDQPSTDSAPIQPTDNAPDATQPLVEDQIGEGESSYPSGFDYSKVDWDQVYSDIAAEQATDSIQGSSSDTSPALDPSSAEVSADSVDERIDTETGQYDIEDEQGHSLDQVAPVSSSDSTSPDTTETESVSDSGDIQSISDVSNWISEINPNFDEFDPDSPYCNNCGSCAYAVYQRLEGNTESCASAENIGYNSEMNALTGMEQVSMSPEEIEQRLLNQGDGAHAIIGIDRAEGPGHWFNAACLNGRVVAIDGQTGEITDWPPDYGDVVNWEMSVSKEA